MGARRHDESNKRHFKRMAEMADEMEQYVSMLRHEGEDCWDESTDDSFEQEVQEKMDDMWALPQAVHLLCT